MSNLKNKLAKGGVTAIVVILILAACYGLSWIVTCGIIKLITMCFGLTFKPHCYQDGEDGVRHFKGHGKVICQRMN